MNRFHRLGAVALTIILGSTAPALAIGDCRSNQNLAQVHRRLDGAIDQLQHDRRDYGGYRERAVDDLQAARGQLMAAEQYAVNADRQNGSCARAYGPTGGSDVNWGDRNQGGSNRNLMSVRRWVDAMIGQLQRDRRDYGGHREQAIDAMQRARTDLIAGERYR